MTEPLLRLDDLEKHFGSVRAVDGVSLDILPGETLALVGESGCGKSTLARLVLRLTEPTAGHIRFEGRDISRLSQRQLKSVRRDLQFIFQDPFSSLDPRMRAGTIVTEALAIHGLVAGGEDRRSVAKRLLEAVGLSERHMNQWPRQFSGGQRQRLGISRAFAMQPKLIVADEPVSALDVSVRSQVINLLQDLQDEQGTAYLFISHDMASVRHMANRVAVMYLGKIVEIAPKQAFFAGPKHPYSHALLSAVPIAHPREKRERILLRGDPPSPAAIPSGCRFHPRCPIARDRCRIEAPELHETGEGHLAACHYASSWPLSTSSIVQP
ncbi:peptide/nickel transport system ATP-binding protein/oligopeptide transport system ATP-binding protein [Bosea sp. BK604]|nr:peptide/nickel transport system ATP-binding protein/oligopeptide transport system ATP-binding protein [Bosea sp. BK604]